MLINYVLAARRLIYLQHILKRNNTELLKKVYLSQKANPKKGDFVDLVSEDAKLIELDINEEDIENMSKTVKTVKRAVRKAAFEHL